MKILSAAFFPLLAMLGMLIAEETEAKKVAPGIAGGATELIQGPDGGAVENIIYLVSWGDLIFFYGPDTDPGLNTKDQITRMIAEWKRRGCTSVFWRTEKESPLVRLNTSTTYAEGSFIMAEIKRLNAGLDTTAIARDVCRNLGITFYIWNSLYDDGTPADKPHRFWKQGFPWRNTFFDQHPELEVRDRKGNVQWGIREMAYPLARQEKIDEYLDLVRKYQPDGVFFYLHSHSAASLHGDQYGFNQPVVDEFKKRYDIDILTDPRFDYENPAFDPKDEMVEKWRSLRGEYLTTFFREAKAALEKEKPGLGIAINTQGGDWFGPPFGNMKIDWRTWIKEDLANMLVMRTWMAGGCGAYDFGNEGYLTWADGEVGVIPYPEIRAEVEKAGHDIQIISRERRPLAGTDGYFDASARLDLIYARKQRNDQFAANMKRDGTIHFLSQDFENVRPLEEKGHLDFTSGEKSFFVGDSRYHASANVSPGLAGPLSEDGTKSPALIDLAPMGRKGVGVRLSDSQLPFTIHHRTGPDFPNDAIGWGKASAAVDIWRSVDASFAVNLGSREEYRPDHPQIHVDASGAITLLEKGKASSSVGQLPAETWGELRFETDFDAKKWTLSLNGTPLATRSLDPDKAAYDALRVAVSKGTVAIDNIDVDWAWRNRD